MSDNELPTLVPGPDDPELYVLCPACTGHVHIEGLGILLYPTVPEARAVGLHCGSCDRALALVVLTKDGKTTAFVEASAEPR